MNTTRSSPRRLIRWKNFRGNPRGWVALTICTFFGSGLLPFAPGTMGTLAAIPLVYFTAHWSIPCRLALWISVTAAGTWAAKVFDEINQTEDNQNIVIDEVVGLGISAWTAGTYWPTIWAAVIAFRFFDIVKIPPVRQVDRWSHFQKKPWLQGFGVMADDVLAGIQALIVIGVLQWLQFLP